MKEFKIDAIIQASLLSHGGALTLEQICRVFGENDRVTKKCVVEAILRLKNSQFNQGIELVQVASGYRYQTKTEVQPWLLPQVEDKPAKMSRAMLETLTLIAYKQPITRAEIEEFRGVSVSSSIIKSLMERQWIRVSGHKEVPGKPAQYSTTKALLDHLGIASLSDLPQIPSVSTDD